MSCIFCGVSDDTVEAVATCASRCVVTAHPACFVRRRSSTIFRKKHHDRSNSAPELCLAAGCVSRVRACRGPRDDENMTKARERVAPTIASPCCENPCSFLRRDGTPCHRTAVRDGACRLHLRDADVLCRMIAEQGEKEQPERPVEPEQPEQPVRPEQPEQQPVQSEQPEQPEQPVQPVQPEQPVEPEQPEQPVEPEQPEQPVEPEQPEQPVEPDEVQQVQPEQPEQVRQVQQVHERKRTTHRTQATQTEDDERVTALKRMLTAQAEQITDLRAQLRAQRSARVDWAPRPDYVAAVAIRRAIETLAPHALMTAVPSPTVCDGAS